MAFNFISASQSTGTGVSPKSVAYAATPSPGSLLLAVATNLTTTVLPVISDANGTWLTVNSQTRGTGQSIVHAVQIASVSQPTSITATATAGTDSVNMNIYEFSGSFQSVTTVLDQAAGANGAAAATSSGTQPSVTTKQAFDLVVSSISVGGAITAPSITSSFTLLQSTPGGAIQTVDAYQIQTGINTFNPSYSWTTSRAWAQVTTSFKAAPNGTLIYTNHLRPHPFSPGLAR